MLKSSAMPINVEVSKNNNENAVNLLRRFTKRVRGSGILTRMRGRVYYKRQPSDYVKKMRTIKSIEKRVDIEKLKKLGKMPEQKKRKR